MKRVLLFAALALSSSMAWAADGPAASESTVFDRFWAWFSSGFEDEETDSQNEETRSSRHIVKSDGVIYDL